jgi:predicted Zn-dependent peptidase
LTVIQLPGGNGSLASVMLVCPLPAGVTSAELADVALINRLIWAGGEANGTKIEEHEFRMITLRFGGSISSQVVADALIIQFTMPAELMPEIMRQMTLQWSGLRLEPQRIALLKQEIAAREQASLTASVQNQLMRHVEKRLWPDLPYANSSYGSLEELAAATPERIDATYRKLRAPSAWRLFVRGVSIDEELRGTMNATLGGLAGTPAVKEDLPAIAGPQLGTTYQLPANLANKHAIIAWRLPAAAAIDQELLFVFAETLRRSPHMAALKEDLAQGGDTGDVQVGVDIRRDAGSFTLMASWNGTMDRDEVIGRLRDLVTSVDGEGKTAEAFAAALKAQKIRYWTRRASSPAYINWRGLRATVGIAGDAVDDDLNTLNVAAMKQASATLLSKENSLILVTVAP